MLTSQVYEILIPGLLQHSYTIYRRDDKTVMVRRLTLDLVSGKMDVCKFRTEAGIEEARQCVKLLSTKWSLQPKAKKVCDEKELV